jgi:hypothetical protein
MSAVFAAQSAMPTGKFCVARAASSAQSAPLSLLDQKNENWRIQRSIGAT